MTRAPWLSAGNRSTVSGASPPGRARVWLSRVGRLATVGALIATVLSPSLAVADVPSVAELVPDARVRAATVLQLGATDADDAVPPLCKALSDDTEIVRIATATALRRLARPSALTCLRERLTSEPAEGPKLQMARAVQSLEARPAAPSPPPAGAYEPPSHPGAKYYVALSPVTSASDRPATEVEAVVLRAVRAKLEEQADFQLAPARETPEAARKALAANKKKKGFFLSISVEKFDYSGGNLRTKVNIAVFSYPAKALIAPIGNGATMSGVAPGSHAAEDQLLAALASAAVKQFVANAGNM